MSELKKKIQAEGIQALKSGDKDKRGTLNLLLNAIKNKEVEKRSGLAPEVEDRETASQLTDGEVQKVIQAEVKKRRDSIEAYRVANREEMAQKEEAEIGLMEVYLPTPLSDEEVGQTIDQIIDETNAEGPQDMGAVMGQVMARLGGRADGTKVSRMVMEALNALQDGGESAKI
ncbi:MAG: aspartyl-tRNA amidotransferase [Candidatus Yanofskybacteria bacterium CG10_big_fil_rev_8_21_14_0_10_46_23]|uniref:Aspartyl-tRNA amidotransferase n=1 Tax=Candidatus Yanofskybacteria bacterium CG10_big_fil_rev_8_21_14_0_10_46_23 TaxID=1975098 RepID=A0A2H0R3K8_9BACT|nr:MAG: aspartyl-tRNA amidotransferase [Candidatus Yanofskybacteria bacterium CG10_big_fil_rev_8_21_14_0_10_46_23]